MLGHWSVFLGCERAVLGLSGENGVGQIDTEGCLVLPQLCVLTLCMLTLCCTRQTSQHLHLSAFSCANSFH